MTYETAPTLHIDDLPENVATAIFGEPIVKQFHRKDHHTTSGFWEVTAVDRETGKVTVTFKQD